MGLGFRVSGFRFQVSGFGSRVSGHGFRVQGSAFRVEFSGFRVYAGTSLRRTRPMFRVHAGFRVWGIRGASSLRSGRLRPPSHVEGR